MNRPSYMLVLFLLSTPATARAQSITFGAKLGVNHATWIGDFGIGYNPFTSHTGVVAGPTFTLGFKEVVALQIEALYSRKGATYEGPYFTGDTYLELPLLLKVALPLWHLPLRPMVMAGVAPAWEVSCFVMSSGVGIPEEPVPPPVPVSCNGYRSERSDVGRITAVGVELAVGRVRITAELRQTSGRNNIARAYAPLSTYNRVRSVMLGAAYVLHR